MHRQILRIPVLVAAVLSSSYFAYTDDVVKTTYADHRVEVWYPVRQAAYDSLVALGVKVEKPSGLRSRDR